MQSGFPARTTTKLELTYAPKEAGSHSGTITFKDADGREVKILVRGVATEPAKLTVDPAVVSHNPERLSGSKMNLLLERYVVIVGKEIIFNIRDQGCIGN
ncbi:hypothetical protein IMSAG025_00670 [Muribaculaceae bacterium]|nr:hypothetical protein IMSAG025_00670 [Muribaculaceae bacterium]